MSSFTAVLTLHMAQDRARSNRGPADCNGQLGSMSWASAGATTWHILINCDAKYQQQLKVKQFRYRPGVAQRVPGS